MRLNKEILTQKVCLEKKGFIMPRFHVEEMIDHTTKNPEWIHFGAGNIFRSFPAVICQELLDRGIITKGIIVAEGYDYDIIDEIYKKHDNIGIAVTLKHDGSFEKRIIASVAEALHVDTSNLYDWMRLKQIFKNPSLKLVTFTITEKGYQLKDTKNAYYSDVLTDFHNNPSKAISYIGKVLSLLYTRYLSGKHPISLVSLDNCSHNGTILREALLTFAKEWVRNKSVEPLFLDYLIEQVTYPITMIDKITPRPANDVMKLLQSYDFQDIEPLITKKHTFIAPYVNAEEPQYLVIEDSFKNGKIPLQHGGVIFADYCTVEHVETMKVCTCLNPLHTALAIFGCLFSYQSIWEEMQDPDLVSLVKKIGYVEGLPVVTNPFIINPKEFMDEVINKRLSNPYIPDTPQRIACDTSMKLSIRFGETIKAYVRNPELDANELIFIPLVLAGWCRYLMGIDDYGKHFELSPDPKLHHLMSIMKEIEMGQVEDVHIVLSELLSDEKIFGVDLYDVGLGNKVESVFKELIQGIGAVRSTLIKYLINNPE